MAWFIEENTVHEPENLSSQASVGIGLVSDDATETSGTEGVDEYSLDLVSIIVLTSYHMSLTVMINLCSP